MMKNKRTRSSGFTTVELIVVLVILVILLSASVAGLLSWQKYSAFKRNNEYAKSLFTAAQSALTHYKVSGKLEDLRKTVSVPENLVGNEIAGDYSGRLYCLEVQKDQENLKDSQLYQLLQDYVYDKSIFNAAIRVEFDPADGVVYSVCYSDRAQSFDESTKDGSGGVMGVALSNRVESVRKDIILGYYSSDLSERAPVSYGKPAVNTVRLINGETLMLTWKMSGTFQYRTGEFTYGVNIFNEDNKLLMSFLLNQDDASRLLAEDAAVRGVTTRVTIYQEDGGSREIDCRFDGYVDSDYQICLILDAMDLEAAEILGTASAPDDYLNTYSIQRFGVSLDQKLYAKVQASGSGYKASSWKASNLEDGQVAARSGSNYEIRYARHLFNIRFLEQPGEAKQYLQTASFAWGGTDGVTEAGLVYDRQEKTQGAAFPPISSLETGSSYIGKKNCSIEAMVLRGDSGEEGVGIFRRNLGSINSLILQDVSVSAEGSDYVGTLCGENLGGLNQITVTGGKIAGKDYVGGIAGSDERRPDSGNVLEYSGLSSEAVVSGKNYVGGILGRTVNARIEDSYHAGSIEAELYGGGIAGWGDALVLDGCESSGSAEMPESPDQLKGTYIGGLVGYLRSGSVESCTTLGGYISGESFVGGMAGYFAGEGGSAVLGADSVQKNYAVVLAARYAGGITGAQAVLSSEGLALSDGLDAELKNFENYGMVAATEACAGGITGFNAGRIVDCSTDVDTTSVAAEELFKQLEGWNTGSMIGGVAGYNNGTVLRTDAGSASDNVLVSGADQVGGLIGFNDTEGKLENCTLEGGYIQGTRGVGGLIGLNCSAGFVHTEIQAKANLVRGEDYVGGLIGLNLLGLKEDGQILLSTDNFLGTVEAAGSFAGGFIGYNLIAAETEDLYAMSRLILSAAGSDEAVEAGRAAAGGFTLTVGGAEKTKNELKLVSGKTYVGGLIGYNAENSRLVIQNVENRTAVSASGTVDSTEQTCLGQAVNYSYAGGIIGMVEKNTTVDGCSNSDTAVLDSEGTYTGGITEKNLGVIQNCTVRQMGTPQSNYLGGLAGRNEGKIANCTLDETVTGSAVTGGFTAENYGMIEKCSGSGAVYGYNSYIGGLAGYQGDSGSIRDCSGLQVRVIAGSAVKVGGVVGCSQGELNRLELAPGSEVYGGDQVGGIAGALDAQPGQTAAASELSGKMTVTAEYGAAGGLIGSVSETAAAEITSCSFSGSVLSKQKDAGGVLPYCYDTVVIRGCSVESAPAAPNGYSGGIAAVNRGRVFECTVRNAAFSKNLVSGGITAENTGILRDCVTGEGVSVTAQLYAGGVAGLNGGTISGCTAGTKNNSVQVVSGQDGSWAGGAAGLNRKEGTISGGEIYAAVSAGASPANLGGAAGANLGLMENLQLVCSVTAGAQGQEYGAGGAAGTNSGTISGCSVSGNVTVTGLSGNPACVGGIAGRNELAGAVDGCFLGTEKDTEITARYGYTGGAAGFLAGTVRNFHYDRSGVRQDSAYKVAVSVTSDGQAGGLAGYVGQKGYLEHSANSGNWTVTSAGTTDGAVGGIAGYSISEKGMKDLSNYASVKKTTTNSAGGIVGRIENATSSGWVIENCINYGEVWAPERAGGILGQWKYRGGKFLNCANYGKVTSSGNIAGGIIAMMYQYQAGDIFEIEGCLNFGVVTAGSKSGGILGRNSHTSGTNTIWITDCVSVGNMGKSSEAGGIIGSHEGGATTTYITRCRVYGKSASGTMPAGLVGSRGSGTVKSECCFVMQGDNISDPTGKVNQDTGTYYFKSSSWPYSMGNKQLRTEPEGDHYIALNKNKDIVISHLSADPLKNSGKELYDKIDPELQAYYDEYYGHDVMPVPSNVTYSETGSVYQVSWEAPDGNVAVQNYEVQAAVYEDEQMQNLFAQETVRVPGTAQSAQIPVREEWIGKYMVIEVRSASGVYVSEWGQCAGCPVLIQEPLPVPKIHLELESGDQYSCILENAGDYQPDTEITVRFGGNSKTFQAGEAGDKEKNRVSGTGTASNISYISFYASRTENNRTRKSSTEGYQGLPCKLAGQASAAGIALKGFTGTTLSDLGFRVNISNAKGQLYYRADVLLPDEELGISVSAASGIAKVFAGSSAVMQVSDLPQDMLEQMVREGKTSAVVQAYIWSDQANMCYYGQMEPFAAGLTAEEVRGYAEIWTDGNRTALKPGYVVEKAGDGSYSLRYAAILAESSYGNQRKVQNVSLPARLPAPVLDETYGTEEGSYLFRWDQEGADSSARYDAVLTGFTLDGTEVQLAELKNTAERSISVGNSGWNYKEVVLRVTRRGTLNSDGTTYRLGLSSDNEENPYRFYLQLDSIPQPRVVHDGDLNQLNYNVTWSLIEDELQRRDLDHYEIHVKAGDEDLILGKLRGEEAEKLLEEGRHTAVLKISLDDDVFDSGAKVEISVLAVAKEIHQDTVYVTSAPGGAYKLTIPQRLPQPQTGWLSFTASDGTELTEETVLTIDEFEKDGFKLQLASDNIERGTYVLEGGIYDSPLADGEPSGELLEEITLSSMTGNTLSKALRYFRGLSSDWAGSWLVVRLRASSSSQIGSHWSDYAQFRLPKIRMADPDWEAEAFEEELTAEVTRQDGTPGEAELEIYRQALIWTADEKVKEYVAWLTALDYGDEDGYEQSGGDYKLTVDTETDKVTGPQWNEEEKKWEDVQKDFEALEDLKDGTRVWEVSFEGFGYHFDGRLDAGETFTLDCSQVRLRKLEDKEGNIRYLLILPDILSWGEPGMDADDSGMAYTGSATLQALTGTQEAYMSSLRNQWHRRIDEDGKTDWDFRLLEQDALILEELTDEKYQIWKVKKEELPAKLNGGTE